MTRTIQVLLSIQVPDMVALADDEDHHCAVVMEDIKAAAPGVLLQALHTYMESRNGNPQGWYNPQEYVRVAYPMMTKDEKAKKTDQVEVACNVAYLLRNAISRMTIEEMSDDKEEIAKALRNIGDMFCAGGADEDQEDKDDQEAEYEKYLQLKRRYDR